MTITQMHTAIEQKLQNLNSYVFENFQPEEIDLFINEEQENFIKQRQYPDSNSKRRGFEDTNKRLADLQTIVKELTLLPVIDDTNPGSRRYLLGGISTIAVTGAVAGRVYQIITSGTTDYTTIGAPNSSVGTVFTASGAGTGSGTVVAFDFYLPVTARINLVVNARPLVITAGTATKYLGVAQTATVAASYEQANGNFYIAYQAGNYASFGSGVVAAKDDILYYSNSTWSVKPYPPYNYPSFNLPVRIVEHENAFRDQLNPHAKATERSLVAVMRENALQVICSERFILKDLILTYIRKPREVSITSSSNCELPEHTHLEIVDMVVNRILEVIEAPRYRSASQESLKNE